MAESQDVPARLRLWALAPPAPTEGRSSRDHAGFAGAQPQPQPQPTRPQPTRPQPTTTTRERPAVRGSERAPVRVPAVTSALANRPAPVGSSAIRRGFGEGGRGPDEDVVDVAARITSALADASAGYAAAHGSAPSRTPAYRATRRWAVSVRTGLAAGLAICLVAGAVALRATSVSRGQVAPVELPTAGIALVGRPGSEVGAASAGAIADAAGHTTGSAARPSEVVVHVVGEVQRPGVVTMPAGSRVDDAIAAAGGPSASANLAALNLARVVVDGEQIAVPAYGASVPSGAGTATSGGDGALVSLNTADASALDELPGIGPVLAGRIVAWRQAHGRFTSVDELGEVEGIGPTLMARLRPRVGV